MSSMLTQIDMQRYICDGCMRDIAFIGVHDKECRICAVPARMRGKWLCCVDTHLLTDQ